MSSSRLISCRCFFRRIERALLSPKHILSFALTPRLLCYQILTLGKLWARLCERIRWWANDFVCSFQKLALRCPICRCREGHGRGERAVALDQFFQFSHIANASFGHHSEGNQNFPRLPRGGFAGARITRTCSFTREVGIPALQCLRSPPDTSDPSRESVPGAGLSVS